MIKSIVSANLNSNNINNNNNNNVFVSTKSSINYHPVKGVVSTNTDLFNNTLGNVNTFDIIPETNIEQAFSNGSNFELEAI